MKNHRMCLFCMALVFLLGGLPLTAEAHSFTDVPDSSYSDYRDAINYCYDNEIVQGVTTTTFGPERPLTRAMFVTFLYRLAGEPARFAPIEFEDVPKGSYYENAVKWGVYEGIIQGVSDTQFAPNHALQKQMIATFLYRFADGTRGYSVETSGSLDCSDAGQIYQYARVPMYWAVQNGVFSDDSYQYPLSTVLRKDAVRYLWRFGTNVDGLISGVDDFGFSNDKPSFLGKDHLAITQQHYNMLVENMTDSEINRIDRIIERENDGLCYGMSLTAILDKMGKIDLNGNFARNVSTLNALPKPAISSSRHIMGKDMTTGDSISMLESALTYYQLSNQAVSTIADTWTGTSYYVGGDYVCPNLEQLCEKQQNGGLALFTYSFSADNSGAVHTVVLYGRPHRGKQYAMGKFCYVYSIYDNRYPNQVGAVYVSEDFRRCGIRVPGSGTIARIQHVAYYNGAYDIDEMDDGSFSAYDRIDIDGGNNNGASGGSRSVQAEGTVWQDTYLYFYVRCAGEFTIADGDGKTAVWDTGSMQGDLEADIVGMLSGDPGTWVIRVEDCDAYTFAAEAAEVDVSLVGSNLSQIVQGSNISQITFRRNRVQVAGNDMTYQVNAMVSTETDRSVTVSGTGETVVDLQLDEAVGDARVQAQTAPFSVEVRDFGIGASICRGEFSQDCQVQAHCGGAEAELQPVNREEAAQ